jgi:hypothetical protein
MEPDLYCLPDDVFQASGFHCQDPVVLKLDTVTQVNAVLPRLSLLRLAVLAARSLPLCFLVASSTCHPSPGQTYIYAIFFHTSHFTLKMVAAWTPETLLSYHNLEDPDLKYSTDLFLKPTFPPTKYPSFFFTTSSNLDI